MNSRPSDTPRCRQQQASDGRGDAAQKRLHLTIGAEATERRARGNSHQKRREKNADGSQQGAQRAGYAIADEGGHDQDRPRRYLAQGSGVGEFLVSQPMMRTDDLGFDLRNHHEPAAKGYCADAKKDECQ